MSLLKVASFLVVLILGVHSKESVKNEQPEESQITSLPKLSKLSEFFIGDLLRTDQKDHLETSSSVNNPITTTEHAAKERMDNYPDGSRFITKYNIDHDHDDSVEESLTGSYAEGPLKRTERVPINVVEKYTIRQAGVLERNVMSSDGNIPTGRYARAREHPREKGDCQKSKHSSSEEVYSDDERSPYASHSRDYRSTPSSYHPEHEHYVSSHGSSSSQPSHSTSHASKTQSQSGKSYSSSKSSSKVAGKPKKVHVFEVNKPAHSGSYQQGHNKPTHPGSYQKFHGSSGDVVVHKVRDTSDSEEDSYSDERPIRGTHSHSDAEPVTQYYEDYPPQTQTQGYQRPKIQSHAVYNQGQEYDSRPSPYGNDHYENSRSPQQKQKRYNTPLELHSQGPSSQNTHATQHPVIYRENAHASRQLTQNPRNGQQHYSSTGNRHQYQQEPQLQPSRPRNGRPQPSHNTHVSETGHVNPAYEHNRQIIRPSEATAQEYAYNHTPYSNGEEMRNHNPRRKISRDIRPTIPSLPAIQSRTENPHILVTKASDPSVSRSVSYSESSYNMNEPTRSTPRAFHIEQQPRIFEEPQKMTNPLHLNRNQQGRGYQTPNIPYNSEYVASYGDDEAPYNKGGNSEDHSYEDPHHGPHQQYDGPHHPYEGPHHPYDSSEQGNGYGPQSAPKTESDITGYKENYADSKPLELDDAFFEKYGISKKAKVIFATAMQPNLFVADGTNIKEGEDGGSHERPSEEYDESRQNTKEERYEEPQPLSPIIKMPGSFTELVDSNPKFLRQYSGTSKRAPVEEFPKHDKTLDDLVFQSGLGDPKAFVRSHSTRELVQKHGNGMSRIIFNNPLGLSKDEESENGDSYETKGESRVVEVQKKLSVEGEEQKKQL